ncbi:MAG: methyltransferase domain-containing protein [Rhodospirillales bacterium]|nr:methyltransferase domain-containing protein [Rhodospirillales bacterium]
MAPLKNTAPRSVRALLDKSKKLYKSKDYSGSLRTLSLVLNKNPSHPEALLRAASILAESGDYAGADPLVRHLVAITPQDHESLCLAGFIAACLGDVERAGAHYHAALSLKKTDDLCNKIGRLLIDIDQPDKALPYFQEAAALGPDKPLYAENLVLAYRKVGRFADAFRTAARAILKFPQERRLKALLTSVARGVSATDRDSDLEALLVTCLKDEEIEHQTLIHLWCQSVLCGPFSRKTGLENNDLNALANNELLRLGLRRLLPAHPDIERILTRIRALALKEALAEKSIFINGVLEFLCALSEHCFFNEYVFFVEEAESQAIRALKTRIDTHIRNPASITDPDFQIYVAVMGCYEPLYKIPELAAYLNRPEIHGRLPVPLRDLVRIQIEEPLRERTLAQTIPTLSMTDDAISRQVRAQYEENPYPRWRSLYMDPPSRSALTQKPMDLLIAGCGTGRQILMECSAHPHANVTAIDLSLASLAYARRKCDEAGLKNVTCLQSDILCLDRMETHFDLISSSGVIHHMADPEKALNILKKLLKPGGVLNLGLYSRRARQSITAFRELFAQDIQSPTPDLIRARRQDVFRRAELGEERFDFILRLKDFYALSSCRDLLFHTHEICYTLPEIGAILDRNDLVFLGFSFLEPHVLQSFQKQFKDTANLRDLTQWDAFEAGQPDAFASMYQFFICRKDEEDLARKNTPFKFAT